MSRIVVLLLTLAATAVVATLTPVPPARAAEVMSSSQDGFGRMVFRWDDPVRYSVEVRGNTLFAEFDAPVASDVIMVPLRLPDYVETVYVSGDRRTVSMPLKGDFTLNVFTLGNGVVVDLRGGPAAEPPAPPPAPAETASAPGTVRVRTGKHEGFQRIVFDWPRAVGHRMTADDDRLVLRFDRPARLAVDPIRDDLPAGFLNVTSRIDGDDSVFALSVPEGATARTYTAGPKVVMDITIPPEPPAEQVAAAQPETEPEAEPNTEPEPASDSDPEAAPEDAEPQDAAPANQGTPATATGDGPAPDPADDAGESPSASIAAPKDQPQPVAQSAETAPDDPSDPDAEAAPDAEGTGADGTGAEGTGDAAPTDADGADQAAAADQPNAAETDAAETSTAPNEAAMEPIAAGGPTLTPGAEEAMAERLADAVRQSGEQAQTTDDGRPSVVSLGFSWDMPTAAAVFRRGGYLWVVFDRFQEVDLDLLRRLGSGVVRSVDQVRIGPNSTIVRMTTSPGYNPSLRRDGLLWVVDLMRRPLRPERPIRIQVQESSPVGARLLLPVVEGGRVVPVRDPELGDQFFVLPLIQLGHGVFPARTFPELTMPVTAQGAVVVPLSDRIEMRSSRSGAEITADGGLTLSPDTARLDALANLGDDALRHVFDIPAWRRESEDKSYHDILNDLQFAVAMAPDSRRAEARLELARYHFANGYIPEALGVLRALTDEDPQMVNTPAVRALRGAAQFLMHRYGEAVDDLSHPSLADVDEAAFWRAAAQSRMGHAGLQAAVLEATGAVLENYPPDVKIPLALVAAEATIEAGDDLAANTFLEAARDPDYNTTHDEAVIQYLEGKLMASTGAFEAALAAWREAEAGQSRRHAALAARDRLDMEHRLDLITTEQLINGLEDLRFAWRGGDFEYDLLRELGALYLEDKRYGDALRTLRLAASYFQERPGSDELMAAMRRIFDTLFLDGGANDMAPLTAIALFDEFRELTPTGNKGDEMIRRLADRLVSVDLLDPAAALLERQIRYRLRGLDRSKVGARLALVYLLNRQPGNALEALEKTRFAPLPERLERQRRHLRARGLADTGDPEAAIALLENDPSEDARVLRAEIHWRDRNWAEAARALAELVPPPPQDNAALSEKDAFRLIDWATALTLAGDETGVSLLRQRYLDTLAGTPFRDAFDLVTATPESGVIDIASVGGKIRQAEKFRSYLTAYRDKLRDERLSAIN
ncbi:tetratricopeptide repeat protein [uncultured Rhodospira sp.]|uniref:tetratricopeptide repeat protein n=1 Tax=uncultured Rhodospira sp. TaxID=1936189 RepID=UPI00261449D2|nr:tetratricopeptide repeat protein [uncultured Rhodospira sp.]